MDAGAVVRWAVQTMWPDELLTLTLCVNNILNRHMGEPNSHVSQEFDAAASAVPTLAARGDLTDHHLLQLYGLYKQATEGPCNSKCPSVLDFRGRAKWGAWNALKAMPQADARRDYVQLLSLACPSWRTDEEASRRDAGAGGPVFSSLAHHELQDCEVSIMQEVSSAPATEAVNLPHSPIETAFRFRYRMRNHPLPSY